MPNDKFSIDSNLEERKLAEVPDLVRDLKNGKVNVLDLGVKSQERMGEMSSKILSTISNSDLGVVGKQLSDMLTICRETRGLIIESGQHSFFSSIPGVRRFINKYKLSVEQLKDKFSSSETQIGRIRNEILKRIKSSRDAIYTLQLLSSQVDRLYQDNKISIDSAEQFIKYSINELEDYKRTADLTDQVNMKHVFNMETVIQLAQSQVTSLYQFEAQITLINKINMQNSKDALFVIQSLQNHLNNTIPMWMMLCSNYLISLQTASNIDIIRSLRETSTAMISEASRLTGENSNKIANELTTGIVDINKLLESTDNLLKSLEEPNRLMNNITNSSAQIKQQVDTLKNRIVS